MKRGPRTARALIAAGLVMVGGPLLMMAQSSAAEAPLGVFVVSAESTGIGMGFGNPNTVPNPPNPVAAGLVPNAVAELGSGPSGHALSSIAWPGPLAGNGGSLANVITGGCVPAPPSPFPQLPPLCDREKIGAANDPVKAEASASGGRDEKVVGPMYAVVDGPRSEARTTINDFSAGSAISASRIFTKTASVLDSGTSSTIAISTGESELNGVSLALGVVKFDSIHTSARATTTGTTATTEHSAVVSGFEVAGQPLILDETGIHSASGNQSNPLVPGVEAANAALTGMHMKIYMTKPADEHTDAGAAVVDSGAVIIDWDLGGSGNHLVYVLGGSNARVQGTPDVDALFIPDTGGFTPALDASPGGVEGGVVSGSSPSVYADTPASPSFTSPAPRRAVSPRSSGLDLNALPAGQYFGGVPAGWLVIGFVGAGFMGLGFKRMREAVLDSDRVGAKCPLEVAK